MLVSGVRFRHGRVYAPTLQFQVNRQPTQPGDVPITFADISKSKELLGYNPTTKIADGIPKFVEWFRNSARP